MGHKAFDETQVVVTAKKEYSTESVIWDFVRVNDLQGNKKRLLIVGDSITGGISGRIGNVISKAWTVDTFTTSLPITDRDFIPTFRSALQASGLPYDVIHFNNGGHGVETPAEFEAAYRETLALMRELQPTAQIVLATSVSTYIPEPDGSFVKKLQKWHMYTDDRNRIVRELCKEFSLELNDLAVYSEKIKDDHGPDGIHYTPEGYKKLSFQVIKFAR